MVARIAMKHRGEKGVNSWEKLNSRFVQGICQVPVKGGR